jgi:protein-tyrosine phosphatase
MRPTIYEIERIGSGFLAVMGRPRAGDWAADEFAGLSELGIRNVVSLLEHSEAVELGLADESSHCARVRIAFHSFPIRDRGLPASPEALSALACDTYHRCAGGGSTLIHCRAGICRAGIGRSGLMAAAVLLHCGFDVGDAFARISLARGVPVPDTLEQRHWLKTHRDAVGLCHLRRSGW